MNLEITFYDSFMNQIDTYGNTNQDQGVVIKKNVEAN